MTSSRKTLLLVLAALASLATISVLAWQNRELRRAQAELELRAVRPYLGMWLPEIWTKTLSGVPIRLGTPPARYQVLYFFGTGCPACQRSAPAMRALAQRLSRDPRVEVVGVADGRPDAVRRDAAAHGFRFPIATLSDPRALGLFKANSKPLLLVADAEGQVKFWHAGAIDNGMPVDDALAAMGLAEGTGEPIVIDRGAESAN